MTQSARENVQAAMQADLLPSTNLGPLSTPQWTPTRAAGLARLHTFLPNAGRAYARDRNIDRGPGDRSNVSALSPWLRRRLITEDEVIGAVLQRHSFAAAEKFIQEVFWRTYWKGWLEMRPEVLIRFNADRLALKAQMDKNDELRDAFVRATQGQTGIDCFDAWVRELTETGWLHNHARMWFASIWTFTLKLPWQLGADFFYKHLLDADPASNTLSWRWVAGLHTRGKHYLARAANIHEKTLGRFNPRGQIDERAPALIDETPLGAPFPIPAPQAPSEKRVALLLHDDDLHPESIALHADIVGVSCLMSPVVGDAEGPAARFTRGAFEDAVARARAHFGIAGEAQMLQPHDVAAWAKTLRVKEVVTPYAPVGLTSWALDDLQRVLAQDGIRLVRIRRDFDVQAWPYAKSGFFKFKDAIPKLIAQGKLG